MPARREKDDATDAYESPYPYAKCEVRDKEEKGPKSKVIALPSNLSVHVVLSCPLGRYSASRVRDVVGRVG